MGNGGGGGGPSSLVSSTDVAVSSGIKEKSAAVPVDPRTLFTVGERPSEVSVPLLLVCWISDTESPKSMMLWSAP